MNLTNEQIEQILDGALSDDIAVGLDGYVNSSAIAHNLSDLREILTLRQRVAELEAQLPKWISVDERLPPVGQECLFFRPLAENSGDEPIAVKVARVDHGQCWESTVPHGFKPCNPSDGYCHVTHWMPIPQPPKEKDDE